VRRILRERERAHSVTSQLQKELAEAKQLREQAATELAEAKKQREWLSNLRNKPIDAIREAGWEGDDLVVNLAKEGTAEGALQRQIRELSDWRREVDTQRKAWAEEQRQHEERQAAQSRQTQLEKVEQEFIATSMNEEMYPFLAKAYKGREKALLREVHEIARQYHDKSGQWASHQEIAEYVNAEWESRLGELGGVAQVATSKNGSARQARATGNGRISTATASERTAQVEKSRDDMTEEEVRAGAIAAARKAIREAASG
jgi:hypothetical protein